MPHFFPSCNQCCESISPTSYFLSCGHFLCSSCQSRTRQNTIPSTRNFLSSSDQASKILVHCAVCDKDCEAVVLRDNGEGLPQSVRKYVSSDPTELLNGVCQIVEYQMSHYESLIKQLKKERATLNSRIQELEKKDRQSLYTIQNMENQIDRLKEGSDSRSSIVPKSPSARSDTSVSSVGTVLSSITKPNRMASLLQPNKSPSAYSPRPTLGSALSAMNSQMHTSGSLPSLPLIQKKMSTLSTPIRKQILNTLQTPDHKPLVKSVVVRTPVRKPLKALTPTPKPRTQPRTISDTRSPSFTAGKEDLFAKYAKSPK